MPSLSCNWKGINLKVVVPCNGLSEPVQVITEKLLRAEGLVPNVHPEQHRVRSGNAVLGVSMLEHCPTAVINGVPAVWKVVVVIPQTATPAVVSMFKYVSLCQTTLTLTGRDLLQDRVQVI